VAAGAIRDPSFFRPLKVKGGFCALTGRAAFLFRRNPMECEKRREGKSVALGRGPGGLCFGVCHGCCGKRGSWLGHGLCIGGIKRNRAMCGLPGSEGVTPFFRQRPTRGCEGQRRQVGGAFALSCVCPRTGRDRQPHGINTRNGNNLGRIGNVASSHVAGHADPHPPPQKHSLRVGSLLGTVNLTGHQ
jgi:hypothetical protein